jgi:hypothetical protein
MHEGEATVVEQWTKPSECWVERKPSVEIARGGAIATRRWKSDRRACVVVRILAIRDEHVEAVGASTKAYYDQCVRHS